MCGMPLVYLSCGLHVRSLLRSQGVRLQQQLAVWYRTDALHTCTRTLHTAHMHTHTAHCIVHAHALCTLHTAHCTRTRTLHTHTHTVSDENDAPTELRISDRAGQL